MVDGALLHVPHVSFSSFVAFVPSSSELVHRSFSPTKHTQKRQLLLCSRAEPARLVRFAEERGSLVQEVAPSLLPLVAALI